MTYKTNDTFLPASFGVKFRGELRLVVTRCSAGPLYMEEIQIQIQIKRQMQIQIQIQMQMQMQIQIFNFKICLNQFDCNTFEVSVCSNQANWLPACFESPIDCRRDFGQFSTHTCFSGKVLRYTPQQ